MREAPTNGAIAFEVGQIDMAVKNYENGPGEYPPDFAGLWNTTYQGTVQSQVLRHLARAFPQYVPGQPSGYAQSAWGTWPALAADVQAGWHIDISGTKSSATVTPAMPAPSTAIVFFLGGRPEWFTDNSTPPNPILPGKSGFDTNKPIRSLLGFGANPNDPFEASGTTSNRIRPAYDFNIASIGWISGTRSDSGSSVTVGGLVYWPKDQGVTDKTTGPMIYFRAESNQYYTMDGNAPNGSPHVPTAFATSNFKYEGDRSSTPPSFIAPAVDTRYSNFSGLASWNSGRAVVYTWVNPQSFQIFTSGLDLRYSTPHIASLSANVQLHHLPDRRIVLRQPKHARQSLRRHHQFQQRHPPIGDECQSVGICFRRRRLGRSARESVRHTPSRLPRAR